MNTSQYVYQRNQSLYPDKIAVMVQFMPTFVSSTVTSDKIIYTTDPDDLIEDDIKK